MSYLDNVSDRLLDVRRRRQEQLQQQEQNVGAGNTQGMSPQVISAAQRRLESGGTQVGGQVTDNQHGPANVVGSVGGQAQQGGYQGELFNHVSGNIVNGGITQDRFNRVSQSMHPGAQGAGWTFEQAQPWQHTGLSYSEALAAENQGLTVRWNPYVQAYEAQGGAFTPGGGHEGFGQDQQGSLLPGDAAGNTTGSGTFGGGANEGGAGGGAGGAGGVGGGGATDSFGQGGSGQGAGFGFDAQYNETMNQIAAQQAQLRSQEEQQRRRLAEDAQLAQDEANRFREDSLTANTERMADSGLVHSGINIKAQQDIGEDYMRYTDEIARARSRGEEDLAQWLTQQRAELETLRGQAEAGRAEREAMRRAIEDMNRAINQTPAPTASGRYPIDMNLADGVVDRAGQGQWSSDANYFTDGNTLAKRIEDIFVNRNVPIFSHNETDAERLARIVREITEGTINPQTGEREFRTLDDVRASVDRIARQNNI
jgi:hypothetical protein